MNKYYDPSYEEERPRIIYPNDLAPEDSYMSEMTNYEQKEEIERLFGFKQDPT